MIGTKTRLVLVIVAVIAVVLIAVRLGERKSNIDYFSTVNIDKLKSLNQDYVDIFDKIVSPDGKLMVVFVATDVGNKNVYGDIVTVDKGGQMKDIGTFNTSHNGFGESLRFVSTTRLRYVEAIDNGGGDDFDSKERFIDVR